MKKILLAATLFACLTANLLANPAVKELPSGYYMVLAAYAPSAENYAIKYVNHLKSKGIEADYGLSQTKNLLIVYSVSYSTRSEAIGAINSERKRTGEPKAWVYVYKSENIVQEEKPAPVYPITEPEDKVEETPTKIEEEIIKKDSAQTEEVEIKPEEPVEVETPISHRGKTFLFIEAYDAKTGKPIVIDFNVIDLARQKLIATPPSQGSFELAEPTSASKMIQVQSNDIGWQKQSFDFKYYEPIIDPMSVFLDNLGDTTFVKFEMTPIRKGQFVTLYQVFFYKDAAIMMGKSEYELNQVVDLMKSNPKLKIAIHGHTNGKAAGKIIALKNQDDVDFFNLNGDHRELEGTAVKLSAERAGIVGRYLESQGIAANRYEVKGWGGKKMLYEKHSPQARYNVRVEIEVVEE
ncbi:MAG: OmpA family protein [Cyclobacteriaceae bacterium]|nr:OmpA family protein [Cyclobacteriaceae bacterium]